MRRTSPFGGGSRPIGRGALGEARGTRNGTIGSADVPVITKTSRPAARRARHAPPTIPGKWAAMPTRCHASAKTTSSRTRQAIALTRGSASHRRRSPNALRTRPSLLSQLEPELGLIRSVLQACAEACRVCGDECERHASMHEHCRVCAEACRSCEDACRRLLEAVTATAA